MSNSIFNQPRLLSAPTLGDIFGRANHSSDSATSSELRDEIQCLKKLLGQLSDQVQNDAPAIKDHILLAGKFRELEQLGGGRLFDFLKEFATEYGTKGRSICTETVAKHMSALFDELSLVKKELDAQTRVIEHTHAKPSGYIGCAEPAHIADAESKMLRDDSISDN